MITPLPLLTFKDLRLWVSQPRDIISMPFGYNNSCWFLSTADALSVICNSIQEQVGRRLNILIPSYFCGQSLRYLRSLNVNLYFYDLDAADNLNANHITEKFSQAEIDVFIQVHFFGRVSGQKIGRSIADSLGAIHIEDCAHVISPYASNVWMGDVLLFSPHKYFPIPSIGLAVFRENFDLPVLVSRRFFSFSWVLKNFSKRLFFRYSKPEWGYKWSKKSELPKLYQPSYLHRKIGSTYLVKWKNFSETRKRYRKILLSKLQEGSGWKPIEIEKHTPFLLGMQCDTEEIAKRRFHLLNSRYQLVMQWPDLPVEIKDQTGVADGVKKKVANRLFFFVHHGLDEKKWISEVDRALEDMDF